MITREQTLAYLRRGIGDPAVNMEGDDYENYISTV